jgi:hypothetical protein
MCCLSAFACQLLVQHNQLAGKLWIAAVVDVAALHRYQLFAGLFLL